MANQCMDTVVFYAEHNRQEAGLARLAEAFMACYPEGRKPEDSAFGRILMWLGIQTKGIHTRGDVICHGMDGEEFWMECEAAWTPMYNAYRAIAEYFGVEFVMRAEEPGFHIYVNTDTTGNHLPDRYKVFLAEKPKDGSLDAVFDMASGEKELYFLSDEDVLDWFSGGGIRAASLRELQSMLDKEYACIYEFDDTYHGI